MVVKSMKKLPLEDYVDFCGNPQEHRLVYNHINQIINLHGFVKFQKSLKPVLIEALRSIDPIMVPQRSTLNENVSSSAFLTLNELKNDLASLDWNECPIDSILTVGSGKDIQLIEGDLNATSVCEKGGKSKDSKPKKKRGKENQLMDAVGENGGKSKDSKQKRKRGKEVQLVDAVGEKGGKLMDLKLKRKRRSLAKLGAAAPVLLLPPPPPPIGSSSTDDVITPASSSLSLGSGC